MDTAKETRVIVAEPAGDWVRDNVLPKRTTDAWAYRALVVMCACQWGPCGHCNPGSHDKCGRHEHQAPASPEGHLTNPRGQSLAAVWRVGTPCRWVCRCVTCSPLAMPAPRRIEPGQTLLF